mmetsp:Transcript_69663/g.105220  ORF Transcript_69663/g.105220 Transcript_69663/m.105220 type:complete len:92 (+) Transcript_69663:569-844(+)
MAAKESENDTNAQFPVHIIFHRDNGNELKKQFVSMFFLRMKIVACFSMEILVSSPARFLNISMSSVMGSWVVLWFVVCNVFSVFVGKEMFL